jgi:chromosome partitioning protein
MTVRDFEFWNVLHNGIDNARLKYDVIIIDTPPSLSYLTINALMASDGIIMPLPPSALDFLSSTQFWGLVSVLTDGLQKHGANKEFDFVDIVFSKVDGDDSRSPTVKSWIQAAYGEKVVPLEIPKTATAGSASAEFGTVYDQSQKVVTQAYDRLVEHIEEQIGTAWMRQVANLVDMNGGVA